MKKKTRRQLFLKLPVALLIAAVMAIAGWIADAGRFAAYAAEKGNGIFGETIEINVLPDTGWEINTMGAAIASGDHGDVGIPGERDNYIVNIDGNLDLAAFMKIGYGEWQANTHGVNIVHRPKSPRERITIDVGRGGADADSGGYRGVTIQWMNDPFFVFNSGSYSLSSSFATFQDIDFNMKSNSMNAACTSLNGSGADGVHSLILDGCTITDTRLRSGNPSSNVPVGAENSPVGQGASNNSTLFSGNRGVVYLHDTVITASSSVSNDAGTYYSFNGGSNANRMNLIMSGATQIIENSNSNAARKGAINNANVNQWDFRGVNVAVDGSAGTTFTFNKTGDFLCGAGVVPAAGNGNMKIVYTMDGSDPTTNPAAVEWDGNPVAMPLAPNTLLRYAAKGTITSGSNIPAVASRFAPVVDHMLNDTVKESDLTISYTDKTVSYDDTQFTVSRDPVVTNPTQVVATGSAVIPGETLYAIKKSLPTFIVTINIAAKPAAPAGVTVENRTATSLEFSNLGTTVQYKLNVKDGAEGSWGDSSTFSGLTSGTEYVLKVRYKATATAFESQELSLDASTLTIRPTPTEADFTINYIDETITFIGTAGTGIQVATASSFAMGVRLSSGAKVTPGQTLYMRREAAGADYQNSATFTYNVHGRPVLPEENNITFTRTQTSITFTTTGIEFKEGVNNWVSGLVFSGLTADTDYTFTYRVAATAASFISQEGTITVSTLPNVAAVAVGTTATVDLKTAADIIYTFTMNDDSFTGLTGNGVTAAGYTFANGTLTIKKAFIEGLTTGSKTFTAAFDLAGNITLTLTVNDSSVAAVAVGTTATVDLKTPADVSYTFTMNDDSFTGLTGNGITAADYTFANGTLTIKKAFVEGLVTGSKTFTAAFGLAGNITLTLTVNDTTESGGCGCGALAGNESLIYLFGGAVMLIAVSSLLRRKKVNGK